MKGRYFTIAAWLTLMLEGCLGPPLLQDGQASGLTPTGFGIRTQLAPLQVPGIRPTYHPVQCEYDERKINPLNHADVKRITLSVKSVSGDRLFVKLSRAEGDSTILTNETGELLDVNVLNWEGTQRVTTEGFDPLAEEKIKGFHSVLSRNPHLLNNTSAILPHFVQAPSRPGIRVADVLMEKGEVWGFYAYRGVLNYRGVRAELFDLIHIQSQGSRVRGFLLFDTQHMLPLLFDLSLGYSGYELEQIGCTS